ncbi:molecular chaperone GrpE [Sedimentibacter acidaminivorans]|uniref:Protein GrpE n=1 Tax=Sedimentibacter acidaminivorans TaxID=913099 RepID=A0ABS4GI14_9FIRM|nr:molecular chaperone GrpE [Sedimentibacter acidaminivorans]
MGKKPFDKKTSNEKKLEEELLKEEEVKETEQKKENTGSSSDSSGDESGQQKEEEIEENKDKVDNNEKEPKSAEEENLNNKLLRLQADFLNYKNRTEKDKFSTYGNAVSDVIKDLLPVLDNLERAIEAEKSEGNSFKDGIKMIYTQFVGLLDKRGLKEIDALNKQFDYNMHYGVSFDSESKEEDGTIIEVLQKGYIVNDKVIRPSMVRIAKK